MKVAIFAFTNDSPTLDTGVTTYNRELVKHLCARFPQHTFVIYLAEKNAQKFVDLTLPNLTQIVVPKAVADLDLGKSGGEGRGALGRATSFAKMILRELGHRLGVSRFPMEQPLYRALPGLQEFDVVFYTVFGYLPDFPLYFKRQYGRRCIAAIHDIRILYAEARGLTDLLLRTRGRYLLRRVFHEADQTLVPSRFIRNFVLAGSPAAADRLFVSYVVPDIEPVPQAESSPGVRALLDSGLPFLFYPSTIVETKNHIALLRAVALLKTELPDIRLVLAGSNTESALGRTLFQFIAEQGLQQNVLHLGFVSESDKQVLYRSATALVIPSIGESFSLPIWEAFALGCAVIASTDRDIPEQVADCALLCDPNRPDDIAAKILRLWREAGLRERLIRMGRARYEDVRRTSLFSGWESILQS